MAEEEIPIHLRGLVYGVKAGNRTVLKLLEKSKIPIQKVFNFPVVKRVSGGISELSDRKIFFSEKLDHLLDQMLTDPFALKKIESFGAEDRIFVMRVEVSPGLIQTIQIQDPKAMRWFSGKVKSYSRFQRKIEGGSYESLRYDPDYLEMREWIFRIRQLEAEKRAVLRRVYDEAMSLFDWASQHIDKNIQTTIDRNAYLRFRDYLLRVQGLERRMRKSETMESFGKNLPN